MAKDPAFPFYASDWLGSTNVALMDAEQERGYLRLLCHTWNSGVCAIENDDEVLAKLSLMNERWFNGGSTVVKRCFIEHPTKPGFLTNAKLLFVWEEREEHRRQRSEAGTKSAQSRKNKRNVNERSTSVATDVPTEQQRDGNSPFPSPSPSSIGSPNGEPPVVPKGTKVYSPQFLEFWNTYPRKEGKQKAYRYWRSAVKSVRSEHDLNWQAAADFILEAAVAFAASPLGTGDYCPHPGTWLNAGRYDDDRSAWNRIEHNNRDHRPMPRLSDEAPV